MIENGEFTGKVILVTGGTAGIGAAVCLELARRGARVIATGRDPYRGLGLTQRAAVELPADAIAPEYMRADATDEAEAERLVARIMGGYGALHGAFNNVGGLTAFGPLTEHDGDAWRRELDLNLMPTVYGMRHQVPAILASGGGAIVNHAGVAGLVGLPFGLTPYVAAKHAVAGLTRAAGLELAATGVRVNAIAPAAVRTELFTTTVGATPQGAADAAASIPMGRIAEPAEIAGAVAYLLSDAAGYVTGTILPVDGGFTAG
jgi:NAD(P)-dependent dehydrogenase (short-subunit alcohol dehydrogenase family)